MILKYTADSSDDGVRLLSVLRRKLDLSASLVRRLKQVKAIYVDDLPAYTDRLVAAGETVSVNLGAAEPASDVVPEQGKIDILYGDAGLIAVNKPAGVLTHPSRSRYLGTLANFVAGYLISTSGSGICHAVNRLDRDTSGVVLFAKNSHMKALLSASLKDERSCKEYIAVADGVFSPLSGTIDLPIKRLNERDMLRITAPDGQRAVTNYVTLCSSTIGGHAFSVLKLQLETGRTHQIRVHCSSCGHPVVGDALYSTASSDALSGELTIHMQALHAYRLSFIEPLTKKELEIVAPVTRSDMLNIIAPLQFEY